MDKTQSRLSGDIMQCFVVGSKMPIWQPSFRVIISRGSTSPLSMQFLTKSEAAASSEPEPPRLKPSPQLNRWSRARALRSGRKLDRQIPRTPTRDPKHPVSPTTESTVSLNPDAIAAEVDGELVNGDANIIKVGKSIYMVSDGTGWTAENCVNAALGQFDYCLVDHGCPVNTHLFSGVRCLFPLASVFL